MFKTIKDIGREIFDTIIFSGLLTVIYRSTKFIDEWLLRSFATLAILICLLLVAEKIFAKPENQQKNTEL